MRNDMIYTTIGDLPTTLVPGTTALASQERASGHVQLGREQRGLPN
jgi:hypothetical protein